MEKVFTPGSWDFGLSPTHLVKMSSKGLLGEDRSALIKRANEEFVDKACKIKMAEGEIPLHLIAMGATEAYGPNRNGDGFKEACLKKYAETFVKHAYHYRHHKNKDPKKSYGVVKMAYYNPQMKRVELLVGLNGTKEAAEKNGGLLADKELNRLESGKDLPVSMACKIAYDVCSACGNKAASRKDYCKSAEEGGDCTMFGCVNGLTKVANDGHIQHVDNPHPTFFDISSVFRNADRIAFGSLADYMQKAASDGIVPGGAALAEVWGVVPPLGVTLEGVGNASVANQIKLAYKLAELEDDIELHSTTPSWQSMAAAVNPSTQPPVDLSPLGTVGSTKIATGLSALAGQKIALPVRDFVRLCTGGDSAKCASLADSVSGHLPGVYNRLIADNLEQGIRDNPFKPSRDLTPASQRQWAQKIASTHSLNRTATGMRASLSAIRNTQPVWVQPTKVASDSGEAEALARSYALYKLAFLASQDDDVALTSSLLVCQNYIS